jgi:hypothetical protein
MRKDRTLGIVLPAVSFLAGAYLLHESTSNSEWYMDFYLIAGAAISAIGLLTASWTIQRHLSVRRMENHAGRPHQVAPR